MPSASRRVSAVLGWRAPGDPHRGARPPRDQGDWEQTCHPRDTPFPRAPGVFRGLLEDCLLKLWGLMRDEDPASPQVPSPHPHTPHAQVVLVLTGENLCTG